MESTYPNIVIPAVESLFAVQTARQELLTGLSVKTAFQREGPNMFLELFFENQSNADFQVNILLISRVSWSSLMQMPSNFKLVPLKLLKLHHLHQAKALKQK